MSTAEQPRRTSNAAVLESPTPPDHMSHGEMSGYGSRPSQALIVVASALVVAVALFPFTAKPISWDELVYMGLAFVPEPKAWRLNRYAHVYALLPFMRLTGDPYVGTRLFWSCSVGVTIGVLVRAALSQPAAMRWTVLALTLLFFAGQEDLFAYPGIAYDEYTAMILLSAAFCLAWTRFARGGTLSGGDAATIGFLLLLSAKSTELGMPAMLLVAVFFITPSGRPRVDRTALRLAACWVGGALLGVALIMGLDHAFLGDALFSLRPATWRELLGYNFPTVPPPDAPQVRMRWQVRPEILRAFLPYAVGGLLWARIERDARLRFLYALPLALFASLALLDAIGRLDFVPRYTIPVLPILSFLPAVALSRLMAAAPHPAGRRPVLLALAAGLMVVAAAVAAGHLLAPLADMSVERLQRVVVTALMLAACGILVLSTARPWLLATVAVPIVVAAAFLPAWRVTTALAQRNVQRAGEAWFGGFYEVARAANVESDAIVFVSERLYDGAIRPGISCALTRMNFNLPLASDQIVRGTEPGPTADYAVVSYSEYQAWMSTHGADPPGAIISTDRMVVLVCLRAPCRHLEQGINSGTRESIAEKAG